MRSHPPATRSRPPKSRRGVAKGGFDDRRTRREHRPTGDGPRRRDWRTGHRIAVPCDRIAATGGNFALVCDRIATSRGGSRSLESAVMLRLDRARPPRMYAAQHEREQRRQHRVRAGRTAERNTLALSATTFRSIATTSTSVAKALSARSLAGMPDASSVARPARAGYVTVLPHVMHHHQCRWDARPSCGRSNRRKV